MNWSDDSTDKRKIRSSRAKKEIYDLKRSQRRSKDIHDHRSWPPGTFMLFDNREQAISIGRPDVGHMGLGIVVANDDTGCIWVLWASNCKVPLAKYQCDTLTTECVFHVSSKP